MRLKPFLKAHSGFMLVVVLFLVVKLLLYRFNGLQWDEAVYLDMAKYLYSGGLMGFFEILRPIMLPLLVGALWKAGFGVVVAGKILAVLISIAVLFLAYHYTKKSFNKKIALLAILLISLTPVFLEHSFRVMPVFWSVSFVLLALCFLKEKKYVVAGILSGAAFLFRFTQGVIIVAVGIAFLLELFEKKDLKLFILKSLKYYLAFFITVVPYFVFNYFMYIKETAYLFHALFRPFIYASGTIAISGGQNNPLFFLGHLLIQNYLVVFIILALIVFFRKKFYAKVEYSPLVFVFLILLFYFSRLDHQEIRYLLDFIIYGIILASFGMLQLYKLFANKKVVTYVLCLMVLLLFVFMFISRAKVAGAQEDEFRKVLGDIDGVILSTTPFPAVELDNEFVHNFYSLPVAVKDYRTRNDIEAFVFYTDQFELNQENKDIIRELILNDNLVLVKSIYSHDYLFFIKDATPLSFEEKAKVMGDLGIDYDSVSVSQRPLDSFITVVLLEDAGSAYTEDDQGGFWEADNFERINEMFEDVKVNWNVVPKHLDLLNDDSLGYLKDTFAKGNVNIVQKGFSYKDNGKESEFFGLDYEVQLEKIDDGKKLIKDFYGQEVKTFVPPFNKADKNTLRALEELGYEVYVTGLGDPAAYEETSLKIFKDILIIIDWAKMSMRTESEILDELDFYLRYANYVIMPVYYPYMKDPDFDTLVDVLDKLNAEVLFYTPLELADWLEFRQDVSVQIDGNNVIINSPKDDDRLTVTVKRSGNYTVTGVEEFKIKNTGDSKIDITLNGDAFELEPGEMR